MFGNAPRAVWSRWMPPDDAGRIALACRAVLVEDGRRKILLEAGIGAFFEPKLRARYGVVEEDHVLLGSLAALGLTDADIDVVVLSHLHFDHAGGLLAAYETGAPLRLLFPRATFVVGETAFERARTPHPRDRASFVEGLTELLQASGRLALVPPGQVVSSCLGERFRFRETFGHTVGLLHTVVVGEKESLFFCSDLAPGVPWVHLPITMGYDRFPEQLIDEKAEVFASLAEQGAWLAFTHDPQVAFARLEPDGRHGAASYRTKDARGDDEAAWDLDAGAPV